MKEHRPRIVINPVMPCGSAAHIMVNEDSPWPIKPQAVEGIKVNRHEDGVKGACHFCKPARKAIIYEIEGASGCTVRICRDCYKSLKEEVLKLARGHKIGKSNA